jgi:hypothetical protein
VDLPDLLTVTVHCQNISFKTCKNNNNNNNNQQTSTHLFVRHLQRVLLFFVFNRGDGPLNDFFNAAGPLIGNDCVLAMVVCWQWLCVGNGCVLAMVLLLAMIISFEEQRNVGGGISTEYLPSALAFLAFAFLAPFSPLPD